MSTLGRRDELARERGFASYAEQRRYRARVTNRTQLNDLPLRAALRRSDALEAIAMARREGISLDDAAFLSIITPQAVAFWAPDAVIRTGSTWVVKPADRIYRPMFVYSDGQRRSIDVRGSRVASDVGRYHSAVGHYLNTGDVSRLRAMTGVRVAGVELETDPDVIDDLARRGVFEFESIYRLVA